MAFADLHLHSRFSDGTFTPAEIAAHATRHELAAIALTDHDTVEGCLLLAAACAAPGIECIFGSELTAEQDGDEIHILGYFLDVRSEELLGQLAAFQKARSERIVEIVERLQRLRIPITTEAVFGLANCHSPGRPHVARVLVRAGVCASLPEAFERFLKKGRPAWVPKFKFSAANAIRLIHDASGLAVLAHPGIYPTERGIPAMVEAGLDGLECFHTKHTPSDAAHYQRLATHFGLAMTGGSDCHGLSSGTPLIGTMRLPYGYVDHLKAALHRRSRPRAGAGATPSGVSS